MKTLRIVRRVGGVVVGASAPSPPVPPSPSPMQKARHLVRALKRWQASGRPRADKVTRQARAAICGACEHWRRWGNFALGECAHPACGCTRAKLWLATEACPAGKWTAIVPRPSRAATADHPPGPRDGAATHPFHRFR